LKIPFAKISSQNLDFKLEKDGLKFDGILKKINLKTIECLGKISGSTPHICDRCGAEIKLEIDQNVDLILSDGVYKDPQNKLIDAMEFFDAQIDLDEVFESEMQAFKSDYFYCENCKNL